MIITGDEMINEANKYYWYHCIDLGNGVISDGDYDMSQFISHYKLPENLSGSSVLDVGRASGFFSFEFERRGADVTATDIESYLDWDFVGGKPEREKRKAGILDEKSFSSREIWGAFLYAKEKLKSKVNAKFVNVYDIEPEVFGGKSFDYVFAGSITSHLRDPVLALEKLYSVTKKKLIISVPTIGIGSYEKVPTMCLVGTVDSDRRSWWVMNEYCIEEMLRCAGFSTIDVVGAFDLVGQKDSKLKIPHIVVHAEP